MENNSSASGSWKNLDDVYQSINSLSRISKIHNSRMTVKHAKNGEGDSNGASSYSHFSNFSEESSYHPSGIGRGQYMDSLVAQYSQGERRAELDKAIHDQLKELNGCGYSNDVIEERFGVPTEYQSFLSGLSSSELSDDKSLSENAETANSEQFEDALTEDILHCNENSKRVESEDALTGGVLHANENSNPADCGATSGVVKQDVPREEPVVDTNIIPSEKQEAIIPGKKNKQRKSRNVVVLNFARANHTNELKAPDDYLSKSAYSFSSVAKKGVLKTDKDSIFNPEDFPAL